MTGDPYPAAGPTNPMTFYPHSGRPWSHRPTARYPHRIDSGPPPITTCPDIPRPRGHRLRFDPNGGRSPGHHHLPGWASCCHFLRGCRRRHRRWFLGAADEEKQGQRQCINAFSYISLLAMDSFRTAQLVERLVAGKDIALITDAGTPGVSDPGARLIRECIKRDLPFTIIPGPSSILTALIGSGFSSQKFFFAGFLPVKSGQRKRELHAAAGRDETTIFFESRYRLAKTLKACLDVMPGRQICVARELTKKFEEFRRGTASELLAHYEAHVPKGEIVLLISER